MRLKPKSTVHNPRAILYRRFTDIETAINSNRVTIYHTEDGKYWVFSQDVMRFLEWTDKVDENKVVEVGGTNFETILSYKNVRYLYVIRNGKGKWSITKSDISEIEQVLAAVEFVFPDDATYVDQTISLSEYVLPETLPDTITYTSEDYAVGFNVQITDNFGHCVLYKANEFGVLTKEQDYISDLYNANTVEIYGDILIYYPIVVDVENAVLSETSDTQVERSESAYGLVECNSETHNPPFVISMSGAECLNLFDTFGYEFTKEQCFIWVRNATGQVDIGVKFTDNIIPLNWQGSHLGSPEVPAALLAKFVDYNFDVNRQVDLDFDSNGSGFYIDADENIAYTIAESDHDINEDLQYSFTGSYKGIVYTNAVLTRALINDEYIIKSPAGENTWQFSAADAAYTGTRALTAQWVQ